MNRPMTCQDARDALSARSDGELDPSDAARLDTHLSGCAACADYARDLAFLCEALPQQLDDGADDADIWARIRPVLDAHDTGLASPAGIPSSSRRSFIKLGLAASVLLAAGVGGYAYVAPGPSGDVVAETINDYLTFRASGKALHITANSAFAIESWLEQRIDFDLSIPADGAAGFTLAGGRLCSFLGRRLVALHFVDGSHAGYRDASLYIMPADGLDVPSKPSRLSDGRPYHVVRRRGVTSLVWWKAGLLYAAVSPMEEKRLADFAVSV